jgi:hypothetical protein
MKPRLIARGVALAIGFSCMACAVTTEVTRVYSPAEAAHVDPAKLRPTAIMREGSRLGLPRGARVAAQDRILTSETGEAIELRASDGVEMKGDLGPGERVPGGGLVESTRSTGVLMAGAAVFGLAWLPTAYVGIGSPRADDRVLIVPLIGPWIDLASRPACVPPDYAKMLPVDWCIEESAIRAALVASGGIQLLGGVLFALGLPTRVEVVGGDRSVAVVPTPHGLAAVGTF